MNGLGIVAVGAILASLIGGLLTIFGVFPFGSDTWSNPRSIMDLPANERREYDEYLATRNYNLGDENE